MTEHNSVRLIANAGVLIDYHGRRILIDALHRKATRFSGVEEGLARQIVNGCGVFAQIDCMLVTHGHPDHYDNGLVQRFHENHPETQIISPVFSAGGNVTLLTKEEQELCVCGMHIRCRRLTHDGEEYANVANYGFLIGIDGCHMIVLGDGTFDGGAIRALIGGCKVDTALLNFPFVTLMRGKKIVREVIRPRSLVVFHLPFEQDDTDRYIRITKHILKKDGETMPPARILFQENQTVELTDVLNA